jgi:hypothetical protein
MLWAPNYGAGYPFTGGTYEIKPDNPDFPLLDTNHDGIVDARDDMYAPYYPGDDAVDWVGMTLYHWGDVWPWEKNIIPEHDKFESQLSGTYDGAGGDDRGLPDFYRDYADGHGKPLAIPETAALYNTSEPGGDAELDIKRAWWRQVFNADVARRLPQLKMINWFEWRKPEPEVGNSIIDWTATHDPAIRQAFVTDLSAQDQLVFGPGPAVPTLPTDVPPLTPGLGVPVLATSTSVPALSTATAPLPSAASDYRRALEFAGYQWRVRVASDLEGPGPNYFSDGPDHVWVDGDAVLHLRAAPGSDGRWYSTEIQATESLGYGTYTFVLASRMDQLDPVAAVGLFTWSDDPAENHREMDIEFATFRQPTLLSGRYTRQPYTDPANVYLFKPPATDASTHSLVWRRSDVTFQSWTGATEASGAGAQVVARHTFVGSIPSPGDEHVHMNVWLDAGVPPTDGRPIEVVIRSFAFTPLQ